MTWIKSATFDGDGTVRITQITYTGSEHSWFVKTVPQGNWNELVFSDDDDVTVVAFLGCMVMQTLEVLRKTAQLALQEHDDESTSDRRLLKVLDALTILDPTFELPVFNMDAKWQMELLRKMALDTSLRVLTTCRNATRLKRYSKKLQTL
jgi:hypothetical protein